MLNNDVSDPSLFTVESIRETREQVNENTRRLDALEQRLAALERDAESDDESQNNDPPL